MEKFALIYALPVLSFISIILIFIGYKAVSISKKAENIEKKTEDIQTGIERIWDVFDHKSVYGKRIVHFRNEKEQLAKKAIDRIEMYISTNPKTFYCLLIDSGTTMFPLFHEITKRIHETNNILSENLTNFCIVTNNMPGIFHMMKYGKSKPEDDYSEIMVRCYMVPGKPLSVYAATTGADACEYIQNLDKTIKREACQLDAECDVQIIGFITGNYMCRGALNDFPFVPVARGEGHIDIKNTIAEKSNELFFISPLMKFSFADIDLFNDVNKHSINDIEDNSNALRFPKKVKYRKVNIPKDKKCTFITTRRKESNIFKSFSDNFFKIIIEYKESNINKIEIDAFELDPRFGASNQISDKNELEIEIPHKELREKYLDGKKIWDLDWCLKNANE